MHRIYHYSGDKREELFQYLTSLFGPVQKGPHGKPYFSGQEPPAVFFSLSHTQGCEVLCLSDNEIGVDCESTTARAGIGGRFLDIAGRWFTRDEQAFVKSGEVVDWSYYPGATEAVQRFFFVWTRKEAYVKFTGNGFSEGFTGFSVFDLPGVEFTTGRLTDAPFIIYSVCEGKGRN